MSIYGYARISKKSQSIDRQIRNIRAAYPDAVITTEAFTGTKIQGRKGLDKVIKALRPGDVLVFDSASRMSRNADEAVALYETLYKQDVALVFLKEPQLNTDVYKKALTDRVPMTGTDVDVILEAVNRYFILLAKKQVRLVFEQAQKEVDDLHQRTAEGIQTARLEGKQIGRKTGTRLVTAKSREAKEKIRKYSADFDGTLTDPDVIKLAGISRNSYYKYKREMREALAS